MLAIRSRKALTLQAPGKYALAGLILFSISLATGLYAIYYKSPRYRIEYPLKLANSSITLALPTSLSQRIQYNLSGKSTCQAEIRLCFLDEYGIIDSIAVSVARGAFTSSGWKVLARTPLKLAVSTEGTIIGTLTISYSLIDHTRLLAIELAQVASSFLAILLLAIGILRYFEKLVAKSVEKSIRS